MKALTPQELMIGDLVKFKPQDNPELGCDEEKIESGEEIDFAKEGCFFPRKITKETLKIIGFRESDVDSYSLTKKNRKAISLFYFFKPGSYIYEFHGQYFQ